MNRATAVMLTLVALLLTVTTLTGCSAKKPVSAADALPAPAPKDIAQTVGDPAPAEVPELATDAAVLEPVAPADNGRASVASEPPPAKAAPVEAPPPAAPKGNAQSAVAREPAPAPAAKASQPPAPAKPTPPQPLPAAEKKEDAPKPVPSAQPSTKPAEPAGPANGAAATVVIGTIVTVSKVPDPATVPYDTCVTFVKYKVNSVVSGSYGEDELLAVFWGMRDGKLEPAARFTTGQSHRLTIEPFSERTELARVMQADDTNEYSLTPYWVVAYTKS